MKLSAGAHLGPYEIVAALGAGGMGEVYRARDARLGRDVAIKVLPATFSSDRERLARFEQEARAAASLSHPNILAVFDVGRHDGSPYIVSELLSGETLRQQLGAGSVPVRKAVQIAIGIADGLAAAHAKGIVHRDLKPENIFLTGDGRVKVLDFGLAKLTEGDFVQSDLSQLPTAAPVTQAGTVLGTVGYMAPEQIRGQPADHRSDIFSFGVVLYEILSGLQPFARDTSAEMMAAILKESPPELPSAARHIPATLLRIVERCLEKNPGSRFQTASDLAFALGSVPSESDSFAVTPPPTGRASFGSPRTAWLVASAVLVLAAVVATASFMRRTGPNATVTRLDVVTPPTSDPFSFALSPDGRSLVFTATSGDRSMLWLRKLDQPMAMPLQGTVNGTSPLWAPDGRAIAFFAEGKLKRLDLEGGVSQVIADAPDGRGGSWSSTGFILFSPSWVGGLVRVPAAGGAVEPVLSPEAPKYGSYRYPQLLPDNRHFLFFANLGSEPSAIFLGSFDGTAPRRLLVSETAGAFAPPDYVLRVNQGVLEARRLDLARAVLGDPTPVAQPVGADQSVFRGAFATSWSGVLAHRLTSASRRQLLWLDRTGAKLGVVGGPNDENQLHPALAPDGMRVAVQRGTTGVNHTFLLDGTPQGTAARLTDDPFPDGRPVWSPDGRSVAIVRAPGIGIAIKSLDTGLEHSILVSQQAVNPVDWSMDGQLILFGRAEAKTGWDLWAVPASGNGTPSPVVQASGDQAQGMISPNLRWVAYDSNESGPYEVYVQPFRRAGAKMIVSVGGGMYPRWRIDGRELFYVATDGTMMSIQLNETAGGDALEHGAPAPLFRAKITGGGAPLPGGAYQYSVARDGKRFLLNVTTDEATASPITIVLNWTALMK